MLAVGMFLVDRYEILAKIGAGGMADVYKAKDHILGRIVAIKVLKPEFSEDMTFVTKFRTEAQSAAGLEHPNIVNIYDVGSENGLHFIVMEHIEGITLKTYIEKKGQLSFKEATSIAIQVARGIESAHNKEITHRDIKPQNIIISTEGKVKVTDFGIARASSSQTISADVMGSVHYASPEQARNGYVDGRSDIYSLGIVMYEMVTGRVPFDGDTAVAVALQHLQEEMVGPRTYAPELPISYEKILLKCTQKNPDRRYQSIPELLADLRKALVTPNEDFVVITPLSTATKTRIIGSDELEMIQDGAKDVDLNQETRFAKEEDFEDYDEDSDDDYDDEDDDDDEDAGFLNPKVEKALTVIGVIVLVLIVALSIFFVVGLVNIFKTTNRPGGVNTQTESQIDTNTNTETETATEDMIEMIDITGMTVEEAEEALKEWGIELNIIKYKESNKEDGTILDQDPAKGTMVREGSVINITVSGEEGETVQVPDLTGLSKEEAKEKLKEYGLELKTGLFMYHDDIPENHIISQNPIPNAIVIKGSKITVDYSLGHEDVEVPRLSGMESTSFETVSEELEKLGFKINVVQEYSDEYADGIVISIANEGVKVEYGSTIDVTVSMGKAPTITYEVTFDFAAKKPDDAVVRYDYTLTIDGKVEKWYEVSDFEPIYVSKDKIESASIYVIWYKEDASQPGGYKVVGEKDYTLEIVKNVETADDAITDENSQQGEEQQDE